MAFLGHTARVIISTATIVASTEMWTTLGFTVQESEPGFTRLTDGQVLVTLIEDAFPSPALAYFHPDPVPLSRELQGMGLILREESESGFAVTPINGLDVYVHRRSQDKAERHSGAANPLLGYLDAFSLGVEDAAASRRRAEANGSAAMDNPSGIGSGVCGSGRGRSAASRGLCPDTGGPRANHAHLG